MSTLPKVWRCRFRVHGRYGLTYRIWTAVWSLLGSYVCFITTGYGWCRFIAETVDNLSSTKLLLLLLTAKLLLYCPVLYKALNMHLWQVSLAGNFRSLIGLMSMTFGRNFRSLIGLMSMTFGGAPNSNVADSLDGAYLGPFAWRH